MEQEPAENGGCLASLTVGLHAIAWLGAWWGLYYYVPWYKKIFEDFGLDLPGSVILLIHLSDWIGNHFYLLLPLFVIALAVDAAIASSFKSRISQVLWLLVMLALPLCAILFGVVSISMTMRRVPLLP